MKARDQDADLCVLPELKRAYRREQSTHGKACISDALDDDVDLTLVPACDSAERGQSADYDSRGSCAYLALSQTDTLVAKQLDGGCGDSGEVCD